MPDRPARFSFSFRSRPEAGRPAAAPPEAGRPAVPAVQVEREGLGWLSSSLELRKGLEVTEEVDLEALSPELAVHFGLR